MNRLGRIAASEYAKWKFGFFFFALRIELLARYGLRALYALKSNQYVEQISWDFACGSEFFLLLILYNLFNVCIDNLY